MYLFADLSTTLTCWGATVATLVLAWSIYKWRMKGPKIVLTVTPNIQTDNPILDGDAMIVVKAANVGDRATTILGLMFIEYNTFWQRLRNKPATGRFPENLGHCDPLPKKLEVGEIWIGFVRQDDKVTTAALNSLLYARLPCSFRKKPIMKRIRIRRESGQQNKSTERFVKSAK